VELMVFHQVRKVRCCHMREADLVEIEALAEVEHDAEVETTNVRERPWTWRSVESWLERQAQHAQGISVDFYADSTTAVEVVRRFVVYLTASTHEGGGGFGQVAAGSVSSSVGVAVALCGCEWSHLYWVYSS
jgi:hypothetical protein